MPVIAAEIFYHETKSIYWVEPIWIEVNRIDLSRIEINWVVVESSQLSQTDPLTIDLSTNDYCLLTINHWPMIEIWNFGPILSLEFLTFQHLCNQIFQILAL